MNSDILCEVSFGGKVRCIFPKAYATTCNTDYTNWPYDIEFCSIRLLAIPELFASLGQDSIKNSVIVYYASA